jgi:serine/threonine protein kinase
MHCTLLLKKFYNEKEARDLAVVILKAIKHCHDHKVVHRYATP